MARLRAQRKVVGGRSSLGVKPDRYSPVLGPTSKRSGLRKSGASAKSPSAASSSAARLIARRRRYSDFATPITPQASRPPALPVGCVLKSSAFSWTITPRPRIERSPSKRRCVSV